MAIVILLVCMIISSLTTCYSLGTTNCVCDGGCEQRGLTEIPQCLPHSIKEILVSRNSISRLDESSFKRYESLEIVDVSFNNLSTLASGTFENTPKLTRLMLRRNVISSMVPGLLKPLTKLELFSVSENNIEEISEATFDQNVNLKMLFLYRNRLSHIGKHLFRYLKKLQRLNLSNNLISSLHVDTFSGNPSLNELFMSFNKIDHLDGKLFEGNAKLEYLDLSGNDLVSFEGGIFKQNPQLMTLMLSDNPWRCDCHMRTTLLELRERKVELENNGKCWTPAGIGDLSTLISMNMSCQMNETNPEASPEQNSGKPQSCDDTKTNFIMVLVGGCVIILAQITICSLFAFYRYVVLKKKEEKREKFMKSKSAARINHYMRSSYEIPINFSNKTIGNHNEYSYIVPKNDESLYACISENDNKYLSIIDYDKIYPPPQQQAEGVYTVMRPQNLDLESKYLTMKGKIIEYHNVR